LAHDRKVVG
jgi:hypothetical protein